MKAPSFEKQSTGLALHIYNTVGLIMCNMWCEVNLSLFNSSFNGNIYYIYLPLILLTIIIALKHHCITSGLHLRLTGFGQIQWMNILTSVMGPFLLPVLNTYSLPCQSKTHRRSQNCLSFQVHSQILLPCWGTKLLSVCTSLSRHLFHAHARVKQ